jgi:MinD superfamily P-loop ATPase
MRTLVVASGKGGTGKTTLSAVLVRLAARNRRLVIADCDVEASNLPVALRAEVLTRSPFAGNPRAVVDEGICEGCGECLDGCRFDALSLSDEGLAVIDPWMCESCGACALACQVDAISFVPHQAGEILVGKGPTGPIVFGRLRPGEDLSGKLVTSVRERAEGIANEGGTELIVIDGPPGVGCPAIASITGANGVLAVTEPTLSGEHDLRRLVGLAHQLQVPVKVVLNKADLSKTGAERIRAACRGLGLDLVGEVAFDAELPSALEAVAQGEDPPSSLDTLASVRSFHAIWSRLEPWVDG